MNAKYNNIMVQNQKLIEQLRLFEKDSYEIQAKIKRGFEVEKENEGHSKYIESLRDKERELLRQVEQLKQTIKSKEDEIQRMQGKVESANIYSRTLEQEVSELRNEQ